MNKNSRKSVVLIHRMPCVNCLTQPVLLKASVLNPWKSLSPQWVKFFCPNQWSTSIWCKFGYLCKYTIATLFLICAFKSQAQTPPSAGSIQQQIQSLRPSSDLKLNFKSLQDSKLQPSNGGQSIVVKKFKYEGNSLIGKDELDAALAFLLTKPIDFTGLQSSVAIVSDLYREKGWIVHAFLPEQDVTHGEVTVAIVEATFGQLRVVGELPMRIRSSVVAGIFDSLLPSKQFLNLNSLDRAMLLADDLPGVAVTGSLVQGQTAGETDIVLQMTDELWLTGNLSVDNTGAVSTGVNRAQASLNLNSPSLIGDALNLNGMSSPGISYFRASYGLPIGFDGWRLSMNASHLGYALISESFKNLNANGQAKTIGLELSYPIVRTSNFNLTQNLALERKDYNNYSANALVSNYKSMPVTLGVNGVLLDELGQGSGMTSFSGGLTSGQLNLNGSPTETMDAASTRTAGSFSKLRYVLSRHQQLGSGVSLFAAWTGQWAAKNLDSSEKFYLGGITGIRAYPSSEGGGSLGQMLNLEIRFQLPDGLNLVGFYDYGWVQQNVSNEYVGAPKLNHFALKGAGISTSWRHVSGLQIGATYARRLGRNPSAMSSEINTGADQDGTLKLDRLWLNLSVAF